MKKLLLSLLSILPLYVSAGIQSFGGNWNGLNDADAAFLIGDGEAQDLSNVDITDNGSGIKKRDGYSSFKTIVASTWGVRGGYYFRDASSTDCTIHTNNRTVYVSKNGGNYSAVVTTDTEGSYYDFTDSNGSLWRANSNNDEIFKYNGSAVTYYPSHPKGNQIEAMPDRLVISGVTSAPNRVYFSAAADFTDFTTGILETSPFTEDIGMPGQNVTALKYAFGRLLIWTRDTMSMWQGTTQFDGIIEDISTTVGTIQPNSVTYDQGIVSFQGNDGHFYQYDGNTLEKVSTKISGSVAGFSNGSVKSWVQTTQTDFEAGTLTGDLSSTLDAGSVVLSTWTDTDTDQGDFMSGSPIGTSLSMSSGSLVTSTTTNINNNSFETAFPGSVGQAPGWYWYAGSIFAGGYSGSYSFIMARTGGPHSTVLRFLDTSDALIFSTTYTFSSWTYSTWVQKTISLASYSGQSMKLEIGFENESSKVYTRFLVSDIFSCNGGSLSFWGKPGASFGNSIYVDSFEGGRTAGGSFLSQTFDTSISSPSWLSSGINGTLNGNTMVAQTQSSSDGSSWDSLVNWTTGSAPTSAYKRYVRYKVTIATTASSSGDATITDVTLAARQSTGTFISQAKEVGTAISSFGNLSAISSGDGTLAYYVRTATSSAMLGSASWVSVTNNSQITASTNPFVQVKTEFTITSATQVPTLENFTIFWNEGSVTRTYGTTDKNHRLLWSLAEDGSSTNNATYIYDMRFGAWLKYSAAMNAPAKVGDYLYFGNPSTGDVYVYPSGTSDAGSSITAYWKSKDFIGENPFAEKIYIATSLLARSQTGSDVDFTYYLNGNTSGTTRTISLTDANGYPYIRNNARIANGTVGTFISFKFGNSGTDNQFEFYSAQYEFTPRPWRVLP